MICPLTECQETKYLKLTSKSLCLQMVCQQVVLIITNFLVSIYETIKNINHRS